MAPIPGISMMAAVAGAGSTGPIAFVGAAWSRNSSTINLTGLGLLQNDLVICFGMGDDFSDPPDIQTPTGYTGVKRAYIGDGLGVMIARKFMGASPDGSVSGLLARADHAHIAIAFRGVNTVTPFDATFQDTSNTSGDPQCPAITTVTSNCLILYLGARVNDTSVPSVNSLPTGSTQIDLAGGSSYVVQPGNSDGGVLMAAYKAQPSAGTVSDTAWNLNGSDDNYGATIALRPA